MLYTSWEKGRIEGSEPLTGNEQRFKRCKLNFNDDPLVARTVGFRSNRRRKGTPVTQFSIIGLIADRNFLCKGLQFCFSFHFKRSLKPFVMATILDIADILYEKTSYKLNFISVAHLFQN